MADSKVSVISRLAQWRIDNFGPSTYKKSDPFKLGWWNWILTVEKSHHYLYLRLFPEPSKFSREQPPFARFTLRVSDHGPNSKPYVSPVYERLLRTNEDFVLSVDASFHGRLVIDVEFLDLKIIRQNGEESKSIWPSDAIEYISTQTTLKRLSRMFSEALHADATINMVDGSLKVHKAILSASSQVFQKMFHHDLKEKESSIIQIEDMSLEIGTVLLSYLYGTIRQEDFWKYRVPLLGVANKYVIIDLKDACEESLMEDITRDNVLERLQEAWLYQLDKLKKSCMAYLFNFAKVYDMKDEISNFCKYADRELVVEIFQELLSIWRPS